MYTTECVHVWERGEGGRGRGHWSSTMTMCGLEGYKVVNISILSK